MPCGKLLTSILVVDSESILSISLIKAILPMALNIINSIFELLILFKLMLRTLLAGLGNILTSTLNVSSIPTHSSIVTSKVSAVPSQLSPFDSITST